MAVKKRTVGGGAKGKQKQKAETESNPKTTTTTAAATGEEGPYTDRKLQAFIFMILAAPWIYAANRLKKSPQDVLEMMYQGMNLDVVKSDFNHLNSLEFYALIAVLSLPHITYYFMWTNASKFEGWVKGKQPMLSEPYKVFSLIAHIIKLIQTAAVLHYFYGLEDMMTQEFLRTGLAQARGFISQVNPFQTLLGFELIILGQVLNYSVYKTIGEAGVYYGCRLGEQVPWVFGFPFSCFPHPQYLGATMSIWGGAVLFSDSEALVRSGLMTVTLLMTVFYTFSSYVEEHL